MTDQEKFLASLRDVAAALRHAADEVERHAVVHDTLDDQSPDHAEAIAEVVHDVLTCVGNLRLHDLVMTAARLDRAARRG